MIREEKRGEKRRVGYTRARWGQLIGMTKFVLTAELRDNVAILRETSRLTWLELGMMATRRYAAMMQRCQSHLNVKLIHSRYNDTQWVSSFKDNLGQGNWRHCEEIT